MKNFKVLRFIQNMDGCGPAFIIKNKLEISRCRDYRDCMDFLSQKGVNVDNIDRDRIIKIVESEVELVQRTFVKIITLFDSNYPVKLLDLNNQAPSILYIKGNSNLLQHSSIGIVGTRTPSEISKKFEKQMIEKIPEVTNNVIISGLALGCDKIAHETTINMDKDTVAVLPNGINLIRPPQNQDLATRIIEKNGCLLSVFPFDTPASKTTYVRRNSIVAALSDVLLVVECGLNSGTLYTVDSSYKMNRIIGCYMPSDKKLGDFSGNEYILKKYAGFKIDSKDALYSFIDKVKKGEKKINTQFSLL